MHVSTYSGSPKNTHNWKMIEFCDVKRAHLYIYLSTTTKKKINKSVKRMLLRKHTKNCNKLAKVYTPLKNTFLIHILIQFQESIFLSSHPNIKTDKPECGRMLASF
ncbi:hypothetical protein GOODEAATRI_027263 [Goodea atripinnis]|uniref:Uncharacterized protein n=1 Tax=Goodea atripinnis TaxID=208336 RepID=A0ABV0N4P9_9TELE